MARRLLDYCPPELLEEGAGQHMQRPFDSVRIPDRTGSSLPVRRRTTEWEPLTDPRRLHREIELPSPEHLSLVLMGLLRYEADVQHHGRLLIEGLTLTIDVWTHVLDDVTEVDRDYARMLDLIVDDALGTLRI